MVSERTSSFAWLADLSFDSRSAAIRFAAVGIIRRFPVLRFPFLFSEGKISSSGVVVNRSIDVTVRNQCFFSRDDLRSFNTAFDDSDIASSGLIGGCDSLCSSAGCWELHFMVGEN